MQVLQALLYSSRVEIRLMTLGSDVETHSELMHMVITNVITTTSIIIIIIQI